MSQPVLLKVYANFYPVSKDIVAELEPILRDCMPQPESPIVEWHDSLLTVAFEGIYFPVEEVLSVLKNKVDENSKGKLDALDIENWRMQRTLFQNGNSITHSAPLNSVLAYSGH